jgi:hypothetical protein
MGQVKVIDVPARPHAARWPAPIWAGAVEPAIETDPLIRGLIQRQTLILTYGASGSTKTVHTLDRDLCLAAGAAYYGLESAGGIVLYIPTEGRNSVRNRVAAYRSQRFEPGVDVLLAILPAAIDLLDPDTPGALVDYMKRLSDEHQQPAVKLTIDTLSRSIPGGDENSAEDMTQLIRHVDQIREGAECAVELVHHAGKDQARGARGHSALRAAVDTEIEVTSKDGYCVASVSKQRDLETGAEFAYRLETIEIGRDRYDHPITTVIPRWIEDHKPEPASVKLGEQSRRMLWLLREATESVGELPPQSVTRQPQPPSMGQRVVHKSALREFVRDRGGLSEGKTENAEDQAFGRTLKTLQQRGFVRIAGDHYWLTSKA